MSKPLSILCVHGVGHGDQDPDLASSWSEAINNGLIAWDPALKGEVTCDFLMYDKLFEKTPLDATAACSSCRRRYAGPQAWWRNG
ncbi:MAG TPA: hypothetical protein VIU93_14465 [Gallionellaceae bacterium]